MAGHSGMAKVEKKAAKRAAETPPENPKTNPKNYVASVGKAFAVLKSFTSEHFELTLSEVAARADLDRDEQVRRLEARPRVKLSERTLTDLDALLDRLDLVKRKGHAVSDGENAYGLRTLATPVFDAQGFVIAGLSVTVDAMRMDM